MGRSDQLPAVGEAFGYASGLFGMGLASYTGVLLGNTAVPLWQHLRMQTHGSPGYSPF